MSGAVLPKPLYAFMARTVHLYHYLTDATQYVQYIAI